MNRKLWVNLIALCGICLLMSAFLTAQQKIAENKAKSVVQARALGQPTVISGPTVCSGESCYEINITCPELQEPVRLSVRAGNPSGTVPVRGTILFFSGARGTNPWDGGAEPQRVLSELRAAGFRTAVLSWISAFGWSRAATGYSEGHGRLACRPATAARWVYDNLHVQTATTGYCAVGHSGGASQVGYMLAQYGLSDIISAAVLTGGPPHSRLDLGCLRDDPQNDTAWYEQGGSAGLIDEGFGYTPDQGPCTSGDPGFRTAFQENSIAYGDWSYNYPRTSVWFLLGEMDRTASLGQYSFYYQRLLTEGSPLVRFNIVPGAGHGVPQTPTGADMIRDALLSECIARSALPNVEVGGRVFSADGRALRNARVTITDQSTGSARTATTSSFGFYSFQDVESGRSYVVGVTSKRYKFSPRQIIFADSVANLDFFGQE